MDTIEYYISNGDNQIGPLKISEIDKSLLNTNTMVWHEGLTEWVLISEVSELSNLIKKVPPPITKKSPPSIKSNEKMESSKNQRNNQIVLLVAVVVLVLFSLVYFITKEDSINTNKVQNSKETSDSEKKYSTDEDSDKTSNIEEKILKEIKEERQQALTPEQLKQKLLNEESKNPLKYLSFNGQKSVNKVQTRNPTMFRRSQWKDDGYNFDINIYNSATLATFYDIEFKATFLSETGSVMDEVKFTIYDYVYPNNSLSVREKVYAPEGFASVSVNIISAKSLK